MCSVTYSALLESRSGLGAYRVHCIVLRRWIVRPITLQQLLLVSHPWSPIDLQSPWSESEAVCGLCVSLQKWDCWLEANGRRSGLEACAGRRECNTPIEADEGTPLNRSAVLQYICVSHGVISSHANAGSINHWWYCFYLGLCASALSMKELRSPLLCNLIWGFSVKGPLFTSLHYSEDAHIGLTVAATPHQIHTFVHHVIVFPRKVQ